MAITVNLKASNAKPTVGDKVTVTATATGQADGATLAYAWTVDGKAVDGTASTLDYTPTAKGDSTVAATVTATTTGDNPTTDTGTGEVKITTANKQFTGLTATATVDNANVKVGDTSTFTGNNNAPKGANVEYTWQVGGANVGEGKTYAHKFDKAETVSVTLVAKVTQDGYDDATVTSDAVTATATEKEFTDLTITLAASPTSVKVGDKVTVTATVNAPSTATTTIAWTVDSTAVSGATGTTYEFTADKAGATVVEATATVKQDGYDDATVESDKLFVTVNQPDYETGTLDYYNPLPQRNSVFYRAGYWVMDLIEKCVADGVDWTDPDANDLKYADELRTVAKLINDFDNVEIQESRNGRIIGKDAIKAGKIYTK